MNLRTVGGSVFNSLRPSPAFGGGGGARWGSLSLKPVSGLLHTMVPSGYTALQEERLPMVELSSPKPETHQNGFHCEGRRLSDRSGEGRYGETEPMLSDSRLSGEEADEEEASEEEGQRPAIRNMPKESPLAMALQILVPFLLAGFGTVSAGMVLDIVQVRPRNFIQLCLSSDWTLWWSSQLCVEKQAQSPATLFKAHSGVVKIKRLRLAV